MRSHRIIVSVIAASVLAAAAISIGQLVTPPIVRFTGERVHDFGVVTLDDPGVELKHVFRLTNSGNTTAHVERIRSSCGCLIGSKQEQAIAAGQSLEIPTKFRLDHSGRLEYVILVYV